MLIHNIEVLRRYDACPGQREHTILQKGRAIVVVPHTTTYEMHEDPVTACQASIAGGPDGAEPDRGGPGPSGHGVQVQRFPSDRACPYAPIVWIARGLALAHDQ